MNIHKAITNQPRQLDAWQMVEFWKLYLAAATSRGQQMSLQHGDNENQVLHNVQLVHFSRLEHATMRQTFFLPATDLVTLHHITPQVRGKL